MFPAGDSGVVGRWLVVAALGLVILSMPIPITVLGNILNT